MKKLIILLVLFIVTSVVAVGIVVNEKNRKTKKPAGVQNVKDEDSGRIDSAVESGKVSPTVEVAAGTTVSSGLLLTVLYPQNNQTVNTSSVLVKGTTAPLVSVMVNEQELVSDTAGNFSKSVSLDEGENYISIIAYNENGDMAETEVLIIRE